MDDLDVKPGNGQTVPLLQASACTCVGPFPLFFGSSGTIAERDD